MGAFYSNIVIFDAPFIEMNQLLNKWKRIAYTAANKNAVFIYDEKCEQNEKEIQSLLRKLTKHSGKTGLAVINHDDDVLCMYFAKDGIVFSRYNSNPSFFSGKGRKLPKFDHQELLFSEFLKIGNQAEVISVFQKCNNEEDGYILESERHYDLLNLFGIHQVLGSSGFGMIDAGVRPDSVEITEIGSGPASEFRKKQKIAKVQFEILHENSLLLNSIEPVRWCSFGYDSLNNSIAICSDDMPENEIFYRFGNTENQPSLRIINTPTENEKALAVYFSPDGNRYTTLSNKVQDWTLTSFDNHNSKVEFSTKHGSHVGQVKYSIDSSNRYSISKDFLGFDKNGNILTKLGLSEYHPKCFAVHPIDPYAIIGINSKMLLINLELNILEKEISLIIEPNIESELNKLRMLFGAKVDESIDSFTTAIIEDAKLKQVTPFNIKSTADGKLLFIASSEGIIGYNWIDLLDSENINVRPNHICSSEDFFETTINSGSEAMTSIFNGSNKPYAYDLEFYQNHKVIYANLCGKICCYDYSTKTNSLILNVPGDPAIITLQAVKHQNLIITTTRQLNSRPQGMLALQIWSLDKLLGENKS